MVGLLTVTHLRDVNFFAGIAAGVALLLYRFDIDEAFALYVCGMLLGGTYEWLGTWMREWTYITPSATAVQRLRAAT